MRSEQHLGLGPNSYHYCDTSLGTLPSAPWVLRSFILADGYRHYSWPCVRDRCCLIWLSQIFLPQPWMVFSYTCTNQYLLNRMTDAPPVFRVLFAAFFFSLQYSVLHTLDSPRLSILQCRKYVCSALGPSDCNETRDLVETMTWNNHKTYLISFWYQK